MSGKSTQLTFTEWEQQEIAAGRLNKDTDEILEIPNCLLFEDDKLKIDDYKSLKVLYAGSCALKHVDIINTPSLETINLNDNQLTEIDLTKMVSEEKIPPLKTLIVSNNRLRQLDVWMLDNLETLWCFNNELKELDCSWLENLEDLNCSANGTVKRMSCLNVDGCSNLKQLDCDCNDLEILDFSHLTSLERISVRQNNHNSLETLGNFFTADLVGYLNTLTKSLVINSSHIQFIDYKFSDVKEVIYVTALNKSDELNIIDNQVDEGYCSNGEEEDENWHQDSPTDWEQRAYERQQEKLRQSFESGKFTWEGQVCLDLSNCDFIKSITIDGEANYPKSLVSINLGGNYLEEVIVRNMPNLRRLIISHNCIKNLIIENCPNLDQSLFYQYKSGDRDKPAPSNGRVYDDETDNPIKQEQKQQEQLLEQILRLLLQAEAALAKQDQPELARLLAKLKELAQQPIEGISHTKLEQTINKFEQSLQTSQTVQSNTKPIKLIIGGGVISLLALGSLVKLIKLRKKK